MELTLPDQRICTLPTSWGRVTLGQSAALAELPESADTYSLLAILLDLSPLEVMNLPADFVNEQVLPALAWAFEGVMPQAEELPRPKLLTLPLDLCTKELPVPTDLASALTFGQATDLGSVLQDAELSVHQKRMRVLAILFYPAYYGAAYDSDGITDFAEQVCSRARLEEAMPLTDFFLLSSTASGAPTPASSSASPSVGTSARPDSKPSSKNGMRWLWSTRWPLATKRAGPISGA